jgi:repressor LexA
MARKQQKGLSERQRKILEFLDRFQGQNGYPPTIREIGDSVEISSTSVVNYYLDQLQDKGFIQRDSNVSRGIRVVRSLNESVPQSASLGATVKQGAQNVRGVIEDLLRIPVVGRIFASEPVPVPSTDFAYLDAESVVDVARSMLPQREKVDDLFALEVRGDSMIDAMVYDGDIVIMKRANQARNGELVAIWLNDRDETTLKYFYLENGRVRLQPANPTMKPIFIDDPNIVQVQGKVVMVIRPVS